MLTRNKLECIFPSFSHQKILLVGDLILDEYIWGVVERISPEAPVQVLEVQREFLTLGGAGNVVANLISLGSRVKVCSIIGQDANGQSLLTEMKRLGVSSDGILLDPGRPTTKKSRILADHQQMLRIDREVRHPIDITLEDKIMDYMRSSIHECTGIILSDYQKGVLTDSLLSKIIELARIEDRPVFIDPKGKDYQKYRKANYLTPNLKEAAHATGLILHNEDRISLAGKKLLRDLELDGVILTRGKDGITLFQKGQPPLTLPTRAREVFDVSGAGDTVLASLTLGYLSGLPIDEAAELANMAAGVVVGKVGTATVTCEEILAYGFSHSPSEQKNKNLQELMDLVSRHRLHGQRIVLTNGCFDLLHVGHIKLLHEAKNLGDILIVAINDDPSVKRIKGPSRPFMTQNERIQILAALNCVDYILVFSEDNPEKIIERLRPEVLVKGTDYHKDQVVGWEMVESYGGCVKLVDMEKDVSISNLSARIVSQHLGKG